MNQSRFPVWASLARDYLPIMATSVSSERAFSQGGITISKRRNRLKGDIVEALQCIKSFMRQDLLFPEPGPSGLTEEAAEAASDSDDDADVMDVDTEPDSWDLVLEEDDDLYASPHDE